MAPNPARASREKNRTMPGTILASVHFGYCQQFMRAISGKADTKDASRAIKRARGVLFMANGGRQHLAAKGEMP
jgi:hypothetical protein